MHWHLVFKCTTCYSLSLHHSWQHNSFCFSVWTTVLHWFYVCPLKLWVNMLLKRDGRLRSAGLHYTTFCKRREPFIEMNSSCIWFHPFPSEVVMYFWARVHLYMCGCTCVYVFAPSSNALWQDQAVGVFSPAALTPHLKALLPLTQHSQWCLQPLCCNVGNYVTHL